MNKIGGGFMCKKIVAYFVDAKNTEYRIYKTVNCNPNNPVWYSVSIGSDGFQSVFDADTLDVAKRWGVEKFNATEMIDSSS